VYPPLCEWEKDPGWRHPEWCKIEQWMRGERPELPGLWAEFWRGLRSYGADHLETMTFVQAQNRQWKNFCNPNPKMAARDRGHLSPNFRLKKA
jgi:hypothetical protein